MLKMTLELQNKLYFDIPKDKQNEAGKGMEFDLFLYIRLYGITVLFLY